MNRAFPRLYAILDAKVISNSLEPLAETLASAGVSLFQYRDKDASACTYLARARGLAALVSSRHIRFLVNDRPDVAAMSGADGVHVGQTDLPVEDARQLCSVPRWVGISTHTIEQVKEADGTTADYIAFGPIFPTTTKQDHEPVVGLSLLQAARRLTQKPLVAIGGITIQTAASVYRAGADCLAVARDLLLARSPRDSAMQFLDIAAEVFRA